MNSIWPGIPGSLAWVDAQGRQSGVFCRRHGRRIDASGLCQSCQREAVEASQARAEVEHARQEAYAQECESRAEMWGMV